MNTQSHERFKVVVAGGGVAALEALLALHSTAGHVVEITLLAPDHEFLYRPVTVAEAFDRGEARSYSLTEIVAERGGGRIVWGSLAEVRPDEHLAITDSGEQLPYDALVVATGARQRPSLEGALTFRGRQDVEALRQLLTDLVDGRAASVAFALPSERIWPLPLYELALMTAAHLKDRSATATVLVVTPEEEPLQLFGIETSAALAQMMQARGIELRCSSLPAVIEGRALILAGGGRLYADRVVTMPLLEGPRLPGLPHDHDGFIPVDAHGRVPDLPHVFAAGDVTTFPLKQGGLAAQQADAVAEVIALAAGVAITPKPFKPVLRGLLLTGGSPLYLRSEPQRLTRPSSVAIESLPWRRSGARASTAAGQALWWPPAKVAGRYLAPYLASARPEMLSSELLLDRNAVPGAPISEAEQEDAVELALLLAECDARWGDYTSALSALDAAEALQGTLTAEFEAKRRAWSAARRVGE
jgi:sulfide:quinone oxidoreductase